MAPSPPPNTNAVGMIVWTASHFSTNQIPLLGRPLDSTILLLMGIDSQGFFHLITVIKSALRPLSDEVAIG